MTSPVVAFALLADGIVDAGDVARLAGALRGWTDGELYQALGMPATARVWRRQQRDLLLCVLAILIAPRGCGPATAAAKVVARLRRFGPGAVLTDADCVCARIVELGRVPSARQTYNVLVRKSAIADALDYIVARGIQSAPVIFAWTNPTKDDHDDGHLRTCGDPGARPRTADGFAARDSRRATAGESAPGRESRLLVRAAAEG